MKYFFARKLLVYFGRTYVGVSFSSEWEAASFATSSVTAWCMPGWDRMIPVYSIANNFFMFYRFFRVARHISAVWSSLRCDILPGWAVRLTVLQRSRCQTIKAVRSPINILGVCIRADTLLSVPVIQFAEESWNTTGRGSSGFYDPCGHFPKDQPE